MVQGTGGSVFHVKCASLVTGTAGGGRFEGPVGGPGAVPLPGSPRTAPALLGLPVFAVHHAACP